MKRFIRYAVIALSPVLFVPAATAQIAAGASQPGITRQQADEILQELRQIRQLLENGGAPQPAQAQNPPGRPSPKAKLSLKGMQMLGSQDAPVTMVEFTDYQCPFCQSFHTNSFAELKKTFIDTGKVRFYSRDMPLDFHPDAMRAAQAGRCAADQKKFWEMREIMASNPSKLDMESLVSDATNLKMDAKAFRSCVETEKYKNAVQTDLMDGMRIGVGGTPSFVIGKSTPDGVDGELIEGALPMAEFSSRIRSLLPK